MYIENSKLRIVCGFSVLGIVITTVKKRPITYTNQKPYDFEYFILNTTLIKYIPDYDKFYKALYLPEYEMSAEDFQS